MNPLDKFEISIRRKSDKVTAAVPQLGLYATAADNHAALDALERKKVELLEDLTAAGEVESLLAVESAQRTRKRLRLWRFILKVVIVVVLAAITVVITTNLLPRKSKPRVLLGKRPFRTTPKLADVNFGQKLRRAPVT